MEVVTDAVPETALDHYEILRRGGTNCGDEDFSLCKCPYCGRIYLVECEADTLYLDPANLDRRIGINIGVSEFRCEGCGSEFPILLGSNAPEGMRVSWRDLAASPWRWVSLRTRDGAA